jgi:hypothetical protein
MMYSDSEALFFDSVVTKTKAHRDISAITNVEELVDATGNDQADHGAKTRATSLAATEADLMFFKEARLNWLGAARVVAGALAAFGPPKLQFGVLKRLKTARPAAKAEPLGTDDKHKFTWYGSKSRWQCIKCCAIKRTDKAWSDTQKCKGSSATSTLDVGTGHKLWAAMVVGSGSTLIWCNACGKHAETRVKGLAKVCSRRMTAQARTRINKINKSLHPVLKHVRLSSPWKYTNKIVDDSAVRPNSVICCNVGGLGVDGPLPRPVRMPNFDDSEGEDFWSEEEY